MNDLANRLESVLNIGYSILMELENEEPDIEKVDLLYQKRFLILNKAKSDWEDSKADRHPEEDTAGLEVVRELFLKLTLLEQNLNCRLESLKMKKAELLGQINRFNTVAERYRGGGQQPSSLFMDIKPGLN